MAPQQAEAEFIPILRTLYTSIQSQETSIQSQEGDQRLRERLSAQRTVTAWIPQDGVRMIVSLAWRSCASRLRKQPEPV